MNLSARTRNRRLLYDFLACLLIILSHFANYILYAGYGRLFPDIFLVFGILVAVSVGLTVLLQIPSRIFRALIFSVLITIVLGDTLYEFGVAEFTTRLIAFAAILLVILALIVFLRDHATMVLTVAFLAMLVTTIVVAALDSPDRTFPAKASVPEAQGQTGPVVVHLILDEHMGAAGMTGALRGGERMRREIQEFYSREGFRLFSHAYSQYSETAQSLASAMNFTTDNLEKDFLDRKRYGFSLKQNAYLKAFSRLNYRIKIFQSNYVDFCASPKLQIDKCVIYRPDNLESSEIAGLPLTQRVRLILNMYYSSLTVIKLVKFVQSLDDKQDKLPGNLVRTARIIGATLWHGRVGPLAVAPSFEELVAAVSRTQGGTMFFGHLLMPHYPYVYGPACKVRSPVSSWSERHLRSGTNTPASRQRHYAEYFDQIRCVMRKLQRLFDVMKQNGTFNKSIIVIHGDHGARINLPGMASSQTKRPGATGFVDGYSSLFAVKGPNIEPGIDRRMLSLLRLLKYVITRDTTILSKVTSPTVYFRNAEDGYSATVLPDFPGALK